MMMGEAFCPWGHHVRFQSGASAIAFAGLGDFLSMMVLRTLPVSVWDLFSNLRIEVTP